ncbi:hypothetical protein HY643_02630 [Candidatus Woesearchaeota archaeon]|nr:hypothetical protein [Candidatus Woesearchaeota archaeon]
MKWLFLLIFLLFFVILFGGCSSLKKDYGSFAKCLTENGVKMYGAYWCPVCKQQEEMFGKSWQYVNYTECSLPNRAGQTTICSSLGITGYPTWEFKEGTMIPGKLSFKQLSQNSNCALP